MSALIRTPPVPVKGGPDTPSAQAEQALGGSKGGLTRKIHVSADALGKPIGFLLTPGQAHDREGADAFLPQITAGAVLADRAFDADERGITPRESGKEGGHPLEKESPNQT